MRRPAVNRAPADSWLTDPLRPRTLACKRAGGETIMAKPISALFEECHRVLPENRKGRDNRRIRNVNAILFPKCSQRGERNEKRVYVKQT
jgi:hypothetical protein